MIPNSDTILIKGMRIYSEDQIIEHGYIKIKDTKIIDFGSVDNGNVEEDLKVIEVPPHYSAVPGFIDVHIHGVNGADTMDATEEALHTMITALPKEGTTSFLATTMTQEIPQVEKAIANAGEFIQHQPAKGKAEILGIHLEGPFVNKKRAGAQPLQHIIDPDLALFERWQEMANGNIRLVTIAPELPNGLEMIRYLRNNGVIASIGHSDATYDQVDQAIEAGANHVTHLFNQMRGLHHREPGVVGAAFLRDELKAEVIVDGIHVRPEMVQLAYLQKRSCGLILITDSMRAKCLIDGRYDLGGQEVTVAEGKAVLADGVLAGSILKLGQAVKNIITFTGCSLKEAIEMVAENPAKQLGVYDRKGSIAVSKDADIVILNDAMEVEMTFCRGELVFSREDCEK